jgi:hypothetical protein
LGAGLAIFLLKSQQWSVSLVDPLKPKFSKGLIIGGGFIRWLIIAAFLLLALSHSVVSMLLMFFSLLIARVILLAIWNQTIFSKQTINKLK